MQSGCFAGDAFQHGRLFYVFEGFCAFLGLLGSDFWAMWVSNDFYVLFEYCLDLFVLTNLKWFVKRSSVPDFWR